MLKRKWGSENNGIYRTYSIPGKTVALVPGFAVKDLPLENYSLGSCACSEGPALGQNTLMIMINIVDFSIILSILLMFPDHLIVGALINPLYPHDLVICQFLC